MLESFRSPEAKNVWLLHSRHGVRRVHKNFFSLIRANWWALESFRPPEPKNVWFPLSSHDVRRVHEKFFSRRFERTDMCLESFWPSEPKNVWFPLSRHDVRRFHENIFLADSSKLISVRVISASWAQKRLFPLSRHDVIPVYKKIFSRRFWRTDGCLESFRPYELKNDWFPLSRHDVPRVNEKFFLADSSELMSVSVISASWAQKRLNPTF